MRAELRGISKAAAGKTLDDYRSDWLFQHAVQRHRNHFGGKPGLAR
jgi:hypothetical protein